MQGLEPIGHGEGEPGLPRAPGAGDRDEPVISHAVGQLGQLALPADKAAEGPARRPPHHGRTLPPRFAPPTQVGVPRP
jgi:hypothetical protein